LLQNENRSFAFWIIVLPRKTAISACRFINPPAASCGPLNRKIHHLYTSKSGEIVVSDLSCYTCDKCIVSDYEHCLHTEHTGQKRLVRPVEEPSSRIVIIISSENLKTGWIFNAPTIFFSRRQCLKTRSNFKHVVFYILKAKLQYPRKLIWIYCLY
jgi:hypothetical protein